MDSRKDQLKKQIIEAHEANDNDLFLLLKSQWAHRFGVESLEELENLDLIYANQNSLEEDHQRGDEAKNYYSGNNEEMSIKENLKGKKEITNDTEKVVDSNDSEKKEYFEIKSFQTSDEKKGRKNNLNQGKEPKDSQYVEALIPLPPKPKYTYLKKWLL